MSFPKTPILQKTAWQETPPGRYGFAEGYYTQPRSFMASATRATATI